MATQLTCKYYHPALNIAVQDVRNVWLLNKVPVTLTASLHRGALSFRLPDSGKRVSYQTFASVRCVTNEKSG